MRSLLNLILEAPLDDASAKKMLDSGKQVSIYYQGDDKNPKGWRKIEPVRVTGTGDNKVFVAYEIPKETSKKPELKQFTQKKIVNWNVLGTTAATLAAKEKGKGTGKKPGAKPKSEPLTIVKRNLGAKGEDFCEAIINKRIAKMYYKGDKEESPGWRLKVQAVAYGSREGVKYIRAWVGSGKSVSGEKEGSKKPLPGWRFFREDRIEKWEVYGVFDNTKFNRPPASNFNPKTDKLMDDVFCISDFNQDTSPGNAIEDLKKKRPGLLQEGEVLSAIKEAINIF